MSSSLTIRRPARVLRLNYWSDNPEHKAFVGVWGNPAEVRMGVGNDSFISIRDGSISLSPGKGNPINIQGMTQDVIYGGLITDLPFPLSMIPTTPLTPWPNQVFKPPLKELIPIMRDIALMLSTLPAGG